MKFKIIKNNNKKNIIIFVTLITVICSLIIFGVIKKTFATNDEGYLEMQIIDNISFTNASIKIDGGITTYSVTLNNTNNTNYNLKNIDVVFMNSNNEIIETLNGYIGNVIESKEQKLLEVSVDKELKDIKKVIYKINK